MEPETHFCPLRDIHDFISYDPVKFQARANKQMAHDCIFPDWPLICFLNLDKAKCWLAVSSDGTAIKAEGEPSFYNVEVIGSADDVIRILNGKDRYTRSLNKTVWIRGYSVYAVILLRIIVLQYEDLFFPEEFKEGLING